METVLLYILGIVIVAIGFVVSIGLHELGHLSFAKLFKVRVGQYMIGFGPTLFSRTKGETEYGIKAIPLGGYIPAFAKRKRCDGRHNEVGAPASGITAEASPDAPDKDLEPGT